MRLIVIDMVTGREIRSQTIPPLWKREQAELFARSYKTAICNKNEDVKLVA